MTLRCDFKVAKWPDQMKAARAGKYMIWLLGESASDPDPSDTLRMAYGPAAGADNLVRLASRL